MWTPIIFNWNSGVQDFIVLPIFDGCPDSPFNSPFNTERDRKRLPGLFPPVWRDPHDEQVAGRRYLGLLSQ